MSGKADSLKAAPQPATEPLRRMAPTEYAPKIGLLFLSWHLDRALLAPDHAGSLFQKSGQFKGRTLRPGQGYRD
jgi:hypothetical protein